MRVLQHSTGSPTPESIRALASLFGGKNDTGAKTAAAPADTAGKIGCQTGTDGVKRCKVETGATAADSEPQPLKP